MAVHNLFGTRDWFTGKTNFSLGWLGGGGFGMIQMHYIYHALFSIIATSAHIDYSYSSYIDYYLRSSGIRSPRFGTPDLGSEDSEI